MSDSNKLEQKSSQEGRLLAVQQKCSFHLSVEVEASDGMLVTGLEKMRSAGGNYERERADITK